MIMMTHDDDDGDKVAVCDLTVDTTYNNDISIVLLGKTETSVLPLHLASLSVKYNLRP